MTETPSPLVIDETFPLRVQENSGQAWKVLADKVASPRKHLWAEQQKAALIAARQVGGQHEPLLEGSLAYWSIPFEFPKCSVEGTF